MDESVKYEVLYENLFYSSLEKTFNDFKMLSVGCRRAILLNFVSDVEKPCSKLLSEELKAYSDAKAAAKCDERCQKHDKEEASY